MLKTIIKRDGSVEDFVPSKLNHWAMWAGRKIIDRVDWSSVVLNAINACGERVLSQELQQRLIDECVSRKNWAYGLMAGRLYAVLLRKKFFGDTMPTVRELMEKNHSRGLMRKFDMYTDDEWAQMDEIIQHRRDFDMAHFQIDQIVKKYSIQNKKSREQYETPQYTFMRMALALASEDDISIRIHRVKSQYDSLSLGRVNAPTPNYMNLGTNHNGYASCCLYVAGDSAASLAAGDHIAYVMTYMSAGIGGMINCRSASDPVRGGALLHQGKIPYYDALGKAVKANLQAGRGGACTSYFSAFDPEADVILGLQDPRATKDRTNRDLHFAMQTNRLFAKKVRDNQDIFLFNVFTAPDLMASFFSGDQTHFETLYAGYEANPDFKKVYVSARKLLIESGTQSYQTGTLYWALMDEINRHTPHKEPIYSSNLCVEVTQPTKAYESTQWLYEPYDHGKGEVSVCSLAAINVAVEMTDSEYFEAAYDALDMIDKCIDMSEFDLTHVGYTSRQRRNAGVGIIGLATALARKGLKYSSQAGRDEIHRISERHMYFVIRASLKLGQEKGNAPWIHKTKWPEGWMPIDTYKKTVDELTPPVYHYDWEGLRAEVIANGGIRHSSLVAHMPTESSSKASGAPNGVYPLRSLSSLKSDASNIIDWLATDGDILGEKYEIAWTISTEDLIKCYAIIQKFTDQAISADFYTDRTVSHDVDTESMVKEYLLMVKYGMKTRYYQNSLTSNDEGVKLSTEQEAGCAGGSCTL